MLSWHYFAIATVLFGSLSSIYMRKMMKNEDNDPVTFMIVFQFILTIITLLFALTQGFVFPPPQKVWLHFLLSAVLYACGSLFSFKASRHIPAGEMTILTAGSSIIAVILGVVFLHSTFSIWNMLGTFLILLSIYVLYGNEKMKINKAMWFAIFSSVCYASASVNDIFIIKYYDAISFIPPMSLLPGLIVLVVYPKKIKAIPRLLKWKHLEHIITNAVFYAFSAITWYIALMKGANITQLSPIGRASIIITVILSALFFGERKQLARKVISAVLVSIGVLLLR